MEQLLIKEECLDRIDGGSGGRNTDGVQGTHYTVLRKVRGDAVSVASFESDSLRQCETAKTCK